LNEHSVKNFLEVNIQNALEKMGVFDARVEVIRPDTPDHGDLSTNVAMTLSKQLRKAPRMIAEELISHTDPSPFDKVEIAGPGFVNFYFNQAMFKRFVEFCEKPGFGRWDVGQSQPMQVEFVSANPTGPVTVANGRGAPLGDSISRLLEWIGYKVDREFYVNDRGAKIGHLGKSLEIRYRQAGGESCELPEEGYPGEYLLDIAKEMRAELGNKPLEMNDDARNEFFRTEAVARMIAWQRKVFEDFGIVFDRWFLETSMVESGEIDQAIKDLDSKGFLYKEDGAVWMKSTELGDDKDFVIIKSNGDPTYTATDIAYHRNKFARGYVHMINLMGADHHGHTGPMYAGLEALGYDKNKLEFHLYQLVHLFRDGKQVKMSKSSGEFVTLEELLEEVGKDAARYFYLMRSSDTHLNFDLDLAKKKTMENPVYYVQYAHVRCCAIMDDERAAGIADVDFAGFEGDAEVGLARELMWFPDEVRQAATMRAPNRICSYAERLAAAFHSFYHDCRVLGEEDIVAARRMKLVSSTRAVLKSCLEILGVSAPERM